MFIQRVSSYPSLGKEFELRDALTEWVKKRQAKGLNIGLSAQLFNPEGATLVTTARFRDLAEFEDRRRQNLADPEFRATTAKFASLSRAPARFELYEVLVPLPS